MYPINEHFAFSSKLNVQTHRITGSIYDGGTLVQTIDGSNIVQDSFSITNQCTDTNQIVFGSCYIGQLDCELTGVSVSWGEWIDKTIELNFGIWYEDTQEWEDIPLGVWTVKEAEHAEHDCVKITAYDNMSKLDAEIQDANMAYLLGLKTDNLYAFAYYAAAQCGVALGMTKAEFDLLPNATSTVANIEIYGDTSDNEQFANDITTYRDLMYWIAQTMCCFCTCDRSGDIVFRKFPKTESPDVTISADERLEGMTLADYITHFTGIYVTDLDTNQEVYYGYDAETLEQEIQDVDADISQVNTDLLQLEIDYQQGQITEAEYKARKKVLTTEKKSLEKRKTWLEKAYDSATYAKASSIELGPNPFLMYGGKRSTMNTHRKKVLKNALALSYTPFRMDVLCGWQYDLGDVIQISGGRFNSTNDSFGCVMAYTFNLNGLCTLEGYGENPALAKVKTKESKQANTANTNAINAKEISSGTDTPDNEEGKTNDVYIKYANHVTKSPKYSVSKGGTVDQQTGQIYRRPVDEVDFIDFELSEQTGYYSMSLRGYAYSHIWAHDDPSMYANGWYGLPMLKVRFTQAGDYKMVCDAEWEAGSDTVGWWSIPGWSSPTNSKCVTNDWSSTPTELAHFTNGDHGEQHYEIDYHVDAALLNQDVYLWLDCMPVIASPAEKTAFGMNIRNFRFEYVTDPGTGATDGGVDTNTEKYVDHVYVKTEDESGNKVWKEIEYVAGADTSAHSGLALNYKRWLSLTPEVMRAWFKADPPQAEQTFNRYCVRYTGAPDTTVDVTYQTATAWSNTSGYPKVTKEHVFTIKNSGAYQSGTVQQIAYKITGLTSGRKYWFNFWAKFSGAEFGEDFRKGLGLVWSTSSTINTDDWDGDPHTYNDTTKYLSMYRINSKRYYEAGVTATASTMYMILTVGDLTDGNDITFTMGDLVIAQEQKKYARSIHIYDVDTKTWVKYKPFGTSDDDSESDISYLNELNDVEISNAQNGQVLTYQNGSWVNAAAGGIQYVEISRANYTALPTADKEDPTKIYLVED